MSFAVRLAELTEIDVLEALIERSVRELQHRDYTPTQIELALETVYGVDTQLLIDRTYFVAEVISGTADAPDSARQLGPPRIVGCGGWSKRHTLFGGDKFAGREATLLDPARDAAKIRAFFVHPEWARRGISAPSSSMRARTPHSTPDSRAWRWGRHSPAYRFIGRAAIRSATASRRTCPGANHSRSSAWRRHDRR